MILKVKEFQEACKSILGAVDTSSNISVSNILELKAHNGTLRLSVTNSEYFVGITMSTDVEEEFVATVDAKLFLTLISKITTNNVEISTKDNSLVMKANGSYKLPMIFEDDKLAELKPITIDNPTVDFNITSDVLLSIYKENSKELSTATNIIKKDVQNMYYVDEQGAITFTSGACVNSFTLPQPVKLLLKENLVKLFKLFAKGTNVHFTLGFDELSGVVVTKARFSSDTISITSLLANDETLLASVPVNAIRGRANNTYTNTINVNRVSLIEAIDRLLLFSTTNGSSTNYAKFNFNETSLTIEALDGFNKEFVEYVNTTITNAYSTMLDLKDLKTVLMSCEDEYLTLHFGDTKAIVIARGNIKNVVPEVHII